MEEASLQPCISLESLSYRWLVNSTSSVDESDFIEMDPRLPPSKRFNPIFWNLNPHDFNFNFPDLQQPPLQTLVPADQLFSDGFVLPLYDSSDSVFSDLTQPHEVSPQASTKQRRCFSMSKRLFRKYFVGLFSHCCRGSSSRVEDETVKTMSGHSDEWSRGLFDSANSIHEAVLHCKKSSGSRLHVVES